MSLQLASDFTHGATQHDPMDSAVRGLARTEFQDSATSAMLDRLAKALIEVGVNPDKLVRRAENEERLITLARLFELPISTGGEPGPSSRKAPAALPKWRLKRVIEYVDAHIADPLTLARLAQAAGMSRMYFASQFKVATGLRPHEYVLRKRIERAQHLLLSTSDPLVEIALAVGFQTQAHFTTIFKKIVGSTPLRWRREQQAQTAYSWGPPTDNPGGQIRPGR